MPEYNRQLIDDLQPQFNKLREHYDYADAIELITNFDKSVKQGLTEEFMKSLVRSIFFVDPINNVEYAETITTEKAVYQQIAGRQPPLSYNNDFPTILITITVYEAEYEPRVVLRHTLWKREGPFSELDMIHARQQALVIIAGYGIWAMFDRCKNSPLKPH